MYSRSKGGRSGYSTKRTATVESAPQRGRYSKDNQLAIYTQPFVCLVAKQKGRLSMTEADAKLEAQKRRLYDISNVLEGMGLVVKEQSAIRWAGPSISDVIRRFSEDEDHPCFSSSSPTDKAQIDVINSLISDIESLKKESHELDQHVRMFTDVLTRRKLDYISFDDLAKTVHVIRQKRVTDELLDETKEKDEPVKEEDDKSIHITPSLDDKSHIGPKPIEKETSSVSSIVPSRSPASLDIVNRSEFVASSSTSAAVPTIAVQAISSVSSASGPAIDQITTKEPIIIGEHQFGQKIASVHSSVSSTSSSSSEGGTLSQKDFMVSFSSVKEEENDDDVKMKGEDDDIEVRSSMFGEEDRHSIPPAVLIGLRGDRGTHLQLYQREREEDERPLMIVHATNSNGTLEVVECCVDEIAPSFEHSREKGEETTKLDFGKPENDDDIPTFSAGMKRRSLETKLTSQRDEAGEMIMPSQIITHGLNYGTE
ncbi:E2F Family like protein [Aduncisulcus paluster]|uniref:E2F Family like protein n=1 Tax=Aduncisulcus paluster TaxID=2918883 RepID=A0ABQ5K292_9EUKA|nr:E2F Family like protein [Aduncisulcus paluster]